MGEPLLSVVVAIVSDTLGHADTAHLDPCLEALGRQPLEESTEVIVPFHPGVTGINALKARHPKVNFLQVTNLKMYSGRSGSREHHGELHARGIAVARGGVVALIEDHGRVTPDWSTRLLEAHAGAPAAVGGAIENGIDRPLNWAVYFCDFLRFQNPLPEGETPIVSDANVAYKRGALESIRPIWQETFHEASVTAALRSRGEQIILAPAAVLHQHRLGLRVSSALRERFVWGRSYAATRARLARASQRAFWARFAPALPALMMARMTGMAWQKRRTMSAFLKAFPITCALAVSWSCGEWVGYVTGRANSVGSQAAEAIARGSRTAG
jgi:hypothetical protein